MAPLTARRVWIARGLALLVDLVQIALPPTSVVPFVDVIDVATAAAMFVLVGWHWAFLPTFLAEAIPFVDLVPSWTLAVIIATRGRIGEAPPAVVVEPPRPDSPPPALPPGDQAPRGGTGS